ncbi:MAG: glycosyltransferase family 39 protein, partial [Chloroflexota bacterium]|nr:glycosyltransferase family 39 protein [Chloroflexota bacterium]
MRSVTRDRDLGAAMSEGLDALRPASPSTGARWRTWPLVAELAILGLILGGALALRLVGIGNDTDLSDEGIRGIQLRLLAAGFRPVSEIYASQGPLSLVMFAPFYLLLGADLTAARLASALYGMVCLVAAFGLARALAGPPAALAATLLLGVSPVFLEGSRRAYVEVPSLAPAMVGLLLIFRWRGTGRPAWLVSSAALLAVGILAKPMAAVVGVAALVLVLAGPRPRASTGDGHTTPPRDGARSWLLDLAVFGAAGLAVAAAVVLAIGPAAIWDQLIGYRVAARAARGWALVENAGLIRSELARDGAGLLALA